MKKKIDIKTITGMGVLIAVVIVLQELGSFIRFGPFSISLVLVPIVVGAALFGPWAGALLGFIFGLVVIASGDATAFLVLNVPATLFTCLFKGAAAGFVSGLIYKHIKNKNVSTIVSAVAAPVTNTGVFLICCLLFFYSTVTEWGMALGFENVGSYLIFGMVGINFIGELLLNIVLAPVIIRVINMNDTVHRSMK